MSSRIALLSLLAAASACGPTDAPVPVANDAGAARPGRTDPAPPTPTFAAPKADEAPKPATGWDLGSSGEGSGLSLNAPGGKRVVTLFCPAGSGDLLVNVPAFRPIGSEERMSFGAGGAAITLVADPSGDRLRGGVSGTGAQPAELEAVLTGSAPLSVSYGAQTGGPWALPPKDLSRTFLAGCRD
jgi:hypothetical protein